MSKSSVKSLAKRTVGVDVSLWQDPKMWARRPPDIIKFVGIKASQHDFKDPKFGKHYDGVSALEVPRPRLAYHYLDKRSDASTQAKTFVQSIAGRPLELPHACDLEGVKRHPSPDSAGLLADEYMDRVEQTTGREVILYTSARQLKHMSARVVERIACRRLWVAAYYKSIPSARAVPKAPAGYEKGDWLFWQIFSNNQIPEIRAWYGKSLDTNFLNGSIADLIAGTPPSAPSRQPAPVVDFEEAWASNTAQHGDASTFLTIVERMGISGWQSRRELLEDVALWQRAHGLDADGKVGPETMKAFGGSLRSGLE